MGKHVVSAESRARLPGKAKETYLGLERNGAIKRPVFPQDLRLVFITVTQEMPKEPMDHLCYIVSQPFPILTWAGPTRGEGVGSRATSFSALPQSIRYGLFCAPCNIALNHCMSGHARRRAVSLAVRPCASSSTLHLFEDRVLGVGFLPYEPRARSLL